MTWLGSEARENSKPRFWGGPGSEILERILGILMCIPDLRTLAYTTVSHEKLPPFCPMTQSSILTLITMLFICEPLVHPAGTGPGKRQQPELIAVLTQLDSNKQLCGMWG